MDETVGKYIPEELLTEILKRLPVKSLLRFRCVLKSWDNLIQSPLFIAIHFKYQKSLEKHLLFQTLYNDLLSLRYDAVQCEEDYLLEYLPSTRFVGVFYSISNGLVCVTDASFSFRGGKNISKILLWNPSIRKYKTLPDYYCLVPEDFIWKDLAFGFSSKLNDYIVVMIVRYVAENNNRSFMIVVYSLTTNSWKKISNHNLGAHLLSLESESVFVDGVAFWIGKNYDSTETAVCFDTESYATREIPLPEVPTLEWHQKYFHTYNQSLAFVVNNSGMNGFTIWVLEGDTLNDLLWKKKISVTLPLAYGWQILGFRNNGEAILAKLCEYDLASYNFKTNEIKDFVHSWNLWSFIWDDEEDFYDLPPFFIYPFVESLEALKYLDEECQ